MICRDEVVNYMRDKGFNILRFPRPDLTPLKLVGWFADTKEVLGSLDQLFAEPKPTLPDLPEAESAPEITGHQSSKINIGVGIKLLDGFLAAMGSSAGVDTNYRNARGVQFIFRDVSKVSLDPLTISPALQHGTPNVDDPLLQNYLFGGGRLFVTTEVLLARRFAVIATDKTGAAIALDVPVIQKAVSGKVKVEKEDERGTSLAFEGADPLAFAFKCYELAIFDGGFAMVPLGALKIAALGRGGSSDVDPAVFDPPGLLDLGRLN